jgi:hypothetical protein
MKVKTPKAKGQSSVEFLMTYGWAILIIGVAMILLWQWGFFNPTGTVKFSSLGFWGVVPADAQYRSNGDLTLSIRNEIVDADINITRITITPGGENSYPFEVPAINQFVSAGNVTKFTILESDSDFTGGQAGGAYDMSIIISYVDNRLNVTEYPGFNSSGVIRSSIEN